MRNFAWRFLRKVCTAIVLSGRTLMTISFLQIIKRLFCALGIVCTLFAAACTTKNSVVLTGESSHASPNAASHDAIATKPIVLAQCGPRPMLDNSVSQLLQSVEQAYPETTSWTSVRILRSSCGITFEGVPDSPLLSPPEEKSCCGARGIPILRLSDLSMRSGNEENNGTYVSSRACFLESQLSTDLTGMLTEMTSSVPGATSIAGLTIENERTVYFCWLTGCAERNCYKLSGYALPSSATPGKTSHN